MRCTSPITFLAAFAITKKAALRMSEVLYTLNRERTVRSHMRLQQLLQAGSVPVMPTSRRVCNNQCGLTLLHSVAIGGSFSTKSECSMNGYWAVPILI